MFYQTHRSSVAFLGALVFTLGLFSQAAQALPPFFSTKGREHQVTFQGAYKTEYKQLSEVAALDSDARESFTNYTIPQTLTYIFGPLTHREIGATKRLQHVVIHWDAARLSTDGFVELPYTYSGTWILYQNFASLPSFDLPVPYNSSVVFTDNWKSCTDSAPDHQTQSFYWYFWDPKRWNCDHKEGREYFTTQVLVGEETVNQRETYPEYSKLIKTNTLGEKSMSMTIGFGYVEDPSKPNPEKDSDYGMGQYRSFLSQFRGEYGTLMKETKILQKEYRTAQDPSLVIGRRFQGRINGIKMTLNVVTSAGIDQMELFAKSFAHDHDGLFAWFGHSRVGSGFDADNFKWMVQANPDYYSISSDYQVIYWGGCNSYSYYSMPFFKFKEDAALDPQGTKRLDIIANGLPSLFSLNAANAMITARTFLNPAQKTSYQSFVTQVEQAAERQGTLVLNVVLGDEDNSN